MQLLARSPVLHTADVDRITGVQIVYERLEQVEEMLRENFGKLQIEL